MNNLKLIKEETFNRIVDRNFIFEFGIGEKGKDDQDLQIKIDGKIELNSTTKSHKNWYWCGNILKGRSEMIEKILNFAGGIHYIELLADQDPQIGELLLTLDPSERIPNVDDPLWTGNFNDDSNEILLARMIFGESRDQSDEARTWVGSTVINRKNSSSGTWPEAIKGVILQPRQYKALENTEDNKKNFALVINPLQGQPNNKAWHDCFKISTDLILNKYKGLTTATHFHGYQNKKDRLNFEKNIIPNGKFIKKIGDLYFYWSPN